MLRCIGLSLCCWLSFSACENEIPPLEQPVFKTSWTKTELDAVNVYAVAGDYYEAKVGVSGNQITGVYKSPNTACWFFFEGIVGSDNPVKVNCYNPMKPDQVVRGDFKIVGDAIIMQLQEKITKKCTAEFVDNVGHSVVLDLQHDWSQVRIVQYNAPVYEQPDIETAPQVEPLPKGSAIAVLERRKNWILAEVLFAEGQTVWIQEHELYPLSF